MLIGGFQDTQPSCGKLRSAGRAALSEREVFVVSEDVVSLFRVVAGAFAPDLVVDVELVCAQAGIAR